MSGYLDVQPHVLKVVIRCILLNANIDEVDDKANKYKHNQHEHKKHDDHARFLLSLAAILLSYICLGMKKSTFAGALLLENDAGTRMVCRYTCELRSLFLRVAGIFQVPDLGQEFRLTIMSRHSASVKPVGFK
jgi:hypothetical protein